MARKPKAPTRSTPGEQLSDVRAQAGGVVAPQPWADAQDRSPGTRANAGGEQLAELGVTGLKDSRGVILEEFLPQLSGHRAIQVYKQMRDNDSIIGALMYAITNMLRASKWTAVPADTTTEAKNEAEFAESLLEDMESPFEDFVSEALTMLEYGWSMFEVVLKNRNGPDEEDATKRSKYDDGRIGIRKLAPRAQDTLWRWEMAQDGTVLGMWQMPPLPVPGKPSLIYLPIERCALFKTISRKGNPEGISILRNAYRSWWYTTRVEEMEAIGIERELAGAPVIRIPSRYFRQDATDREKQILQEYKTVARDFKKNEQGGLVIPSDPWFDADGKPLPGAYQVDVTLLSSGGSRQIDTDRIVTRHQTNIARSVLADFIMLGNQGRGAYALSKNKTDLFLKACETFINIVAAGLNRATLPQVWEANALDPELMPQYRPGRIAPVDLVELGGFLRDFAQAGAELFPDPDLENYVREMADLPEKSEETINEQNKIMQQMLQAKQTARAPAAAGPAAKPPAGPQEAPGPKATGGNAGAAKPNGKGNGADVSKFNEKHVPAGSPEGGQFDFADGGGGGGGLGHGYSTDARLVRGVVHTSNVRDAVRALYENKKVELNQPREVSTLLDKLRAVSKRMIERGDDAPNFNLCNVSVSGTNLFCAEGKGIPRIKMPQIDDAKAFRRHLEDDLGVKVIKTEEKAAYLRATQSELNGAKVAKIARQIRSGKIDLNEKRIIVSRDNYIVDGHHHWAAQIGIDAQDNKLGDVDTKIMRVDMNIIPLLREANLYSGPRKDISKAYRACSGIDLSHVIAEGGIMRSNRAAAITFSREDADAALSKSDPFPYIVEIELGEDPPVLKLGDDLALLAGARLQVNGVDRTGEVPVISARLID